MQAWNCIAAELSKLAPFQPYGGVKAEACRRKFDSVLGSFIDRENGAPFRSGSDEEYSEVWLQY